MRRLLPLALAALVTGLGIKCNPVKIDEARELQIGQEAARKLEAESGVWADAAQTTHVRAIGMSIARRTTRPHLPWSFKILDDAQINAMALPGGYVYVTRGLIASGFDDTQLAGVLGHEIAHVTQRHAIKLMEKALAGEVIVAVATKDSSSDLQKAADIALELVVRRGYREEEYDADRVGTKWAYVSGYPAHGLLDFLRAIRQREGSDPSQLQVWLSTHPPTSERIKRLEGFVRALAAAPAAVSFAS